MVLAGLGFLVICLAANATPRRPVAGPLNTSIPTARQTASSAPPITDLPEPVRASHFHFNVPWWLFYKLLIVLLPTVGVLLLILLIVRLVPGMHLPRVRRPAVEQTEDLPSIRPDEVASQVTATLDDTIAAFRQGDRQRAVIACWIRLEQIAEAAGFARQRSETSSELADRWLARLPLSREPLLTLAELYREARYSSHRLPDAALDTARSALEQLRREITASAGRDQA
jgi:hypothetical protein